MSDKWVCKCGWHNGINLAHCASCGRTPREGEAALHYGQSSLHLGKASMPAVEPKPIDMVLYCPKCNKQHLDHPDPGAWVDMQGGHRLYYKPMWTNPPHKTHKCGSCGHLWRPSDHPTNGVTRTASDKDNDTRPRPTYPVVRFRSYGGLEADRIWFNEWDEMQARLTRIEDDIDVTG